MLAIGSAWADDNNGYQQLLRQRKMWLYKTTAAEGGTEPIMQTETVVPDTVIDGMTCQRTLIGLPIPQEGAPTPPIDYFDEQIGSNIKGVYFEVIYREDNGKVYFYSKEQKKFFLIMDFNLKPGDKLNRQLADGTVQTLECVANDVIEAGEARRHRIVIDGETWVEGIGGERPLYEYVTQPDSPRAQFRGMFEFGRLIFRPNDFDVPAMKKASDSTVNAGRQQQ